MGQKVTRKFACIMLESPSSMKGKNLIHTLIGVEKCVAPLTKGLCVVVIDLQRSFKNKICMHVLTYATQELR